MRQVVLSLCSIILILSMNLRVSGQSHDLQQIKLIYTADNLPIESDEFIEEVRIELQEDNYGLEIVEDGADANLEITFNLDENEQIVFTLQAITPTELAASSILYTHAGEPFTFTITDWENQSESLVALTTGIALYSVEEWFWASHRLNYASNLITSDTSYYIKLYEGNCYLALASYEDAFYEYSVSAVGYFDQVPLYVNSTWALLQLKPDWTSRYGMPRDFNLKFDVLGQLLHSYNPTTEQALEILTHRAQLYALAFDYDSAIADMDSAIELAEANDMSDEQLAELYTLRGEIIFLIYEWDRVLDNFNTALELDADYAPAYFQRGVLYYTMALREEALADFQHYLEVAPDAINAVEAQRYINSIQTELDTLGG